MLLNLKNLIPLCIALLCVAVTKADFPNDPQPCKFGDTQCIQERVQYYFKHKSEGDKSINLHIIDPLRIPLVSISKDEDSPLNIDLKLKNLLISGLRNAEIVNVSGFGSDMTQTHGFICKVQQLFITGDYTAKGEVIIVSIDGSGRHEFTATDVTLYGEFNGKTEERNGAKFMQVDKMEVVIDAKHISFTFHNIFHDNKEMTDSMNALINSEWTELWAMARKDFTRCLQDAIRTIFDDVFAKYPYNEFFLNE